MNFDEMNAAINQAKGTLSLADHFAAKMAALIVGRLRRVDGWTLRQLKRELRDYNPHTKTWKR